ncbi:MAG TPA: hypothetical protein VHC69_28645 [Polyangiaceae bacterium]|nr:hypothetical protein [Polyangiaceae bacterium]
MTKDNVHDPARIAQATLILAVLGEWLAGGEGRRLTVEHTAGAGLTATLHERQTSKGEDLTDALAQLATPLAVERHGP